MAILRKVWASLLQHIWINQDEKWFQQDIAMSHTPHGSLAWLNGLGSDFSRGQQKM